MPRRPPRRRCCPRGRSPAARPNISCRRSRPCRASIRFRRATPRCRPFAASRAAACCSCIDGARVTLGAAGRAERDVPRSGDARRHRRRARPGIRSPTDRMRSAASSRCGRRTVQANAPAARRRPRRRRRRHSRSARLGGSLEGLRDGRNPGPGPRARRRRLGQPGGRHRDLQLRLEGRRLPGQGQPRSSAPGVLIGRLAE